MELTDRLLLILAGPDRSKANRQLMAAAYTEDEIRGARNLARSAGYLESTGLGQNRVTPVRRARAAEIRSSYEGKKKRPPESRGSFSRPIGENRSEIGELSEGRNPT